LKQQLQASQGIIKELEAEQLRLAGVNFENQQLRDEITNLQNQLQTSEVQLGESVGKNREAERYAQLQNQIVELKRQAEEGQATARELKAVQEQLDAVESREMILKVQQHMLEVQIENLQRALFMEKQAVQELDATRERLAGMERVCQELREENRRLEDDISRWQVRPAAAKGYGGSEFSERWLRGAANPMDLSSDDSAARVPTSVVQSLSSALRYCRMTALSMRLQKIQSVTSSVLIFLFLHS